MTTRIAPSAALEAAIQELLAEGLGEGERLAEIRRLGARLMLQRAVEEEVMAFLGGARSERTRRRAQQRDLFAADELDYAEGEPGQPRQTAEAFYGPHVERLPNSS